MFRHVKKFIVIIFIFLLTSSLYAEPQGKRQEMPPAQVVAAEVTMGMVSPENEFIGTVYYQEVSDVAAEVSGKVKKVNFEEGQRVRKGDELAGLDSDLLEKTLQATRAGYEQVLSDLEKARLDLKRAESLFQNELVTEQTYDERRFMVSGLEKRTISLKADVERFEAELEKKTVKSPFDGIVLKRHVDRGEWLNEGSTVATIAMEDSMDVIAEVADSIVGYVKRGMSVNVTAGREVFTGSVIAVIPRGDISTRTFPVKIRVNNGRSLIEGMEARVTLPTGKKEKALIVPRDAVITAMGNSFVYAVNDTKAAMITVTVVGYNGMTVGIRGEGLSEGMKVVVKGNERLREGQAVMIQQ